MKEHASGVQNLFSLKSYIYGLLRKLRLCKWVSPKMRQIIKQAGPSRQLFETVNFAFMKIFDFFVKIVVFWAFLLFLGDLRHALRPQSNTQTGQNARHKSPKKKEKCQKMVLLTKELKNFIKAKLTVSKSYLLGLVCFMIFCILRGDLI